MKKRTLLLLALCVAAVGGLLAYAAGGTSADPLISKSYLDGTYTDSVLETAGSRLDAADSSLSAGARDELAAMTSSVETALSGDCVTTFAERRFKQGDVLAGTAGTNVLVLAGSVTVSFSSGAVVDVTDGKTVPSGTVLTVNHRYMTAEDTNARYTTTSKTSVVRYLGYYGITESGTVPDYNAMARALRTLNLMKGSATGFGDGFDLEAVPTRAAALIMFVRLLGEEEQALAYTGTCPFTDVDKSGAAWPYIAYAYSMGYTNGYTKTTFRPKQAVNARQYTEFLLRAMGYSSMSNSDLSGTLVNARENGVITAAERTALESGSFLRADLVYVSYYALQASLPGGGATLADQLMGKGIFSSSAYRTALSSVSSARIS